MNDEELQEHITKILFEHHHQGSGDAARIAKDLIARVKQYLVEDAAAQSTS